MEGALLLEVSKRIKQFRTDKRLTVQELADRSGVSKGLVSQVENGRSIPSLPVLFSMIQSLELEVGEFFKDISLQEANVLVQKKEDYIAFEKEYATGFRYSRIFMKNLPPSATDFVLLKLDVDAQRDMVSTEAYEYKYILKGSVDYHINGQVYSLNEGDSLFFDGRLPHVPKNTGRIPCEMLIIYFFNQK
jgi:transcriptional regulator with XRE-family HTH domain